MADLLVLASSRAGECSHDEKTLLSQGEASDGGRHWWRRQHDTCDWTYCGLRVLDASRTSVNGTDQTFHSRGWSRHGRLWSK